MGPSGRVFCWDDLRWEVGVWCVFGVLPVKSLLKRAAVLFIRDCGGAVAETGETLSWFFILLFKGFIPLVNCKEDDTPGITLG